MVNSPRENIPSPDRKLSDPSIPGFSIPSLSILSEIISHKQQEVSLAQKKLPLDEVKRKNHDFQPTPWLTNLRATSQRPHTVIAEIKRASPSRGLFAPGLDPIATAIDYARSGASAISVLTDEKYFNGQLDFIKQIKQEFSRLQLSTSLPPVPLLRKDFIINTYQVWETRNAEADALLLIASALSLDLIKELIKESVEAGLGMLIETHNIAEVHRVLEVCTVVPESKSLVALGINNRNLNSFTVDISTTENILKETLSSIQDILGANAVIVSESGISSSGEMARLSLAGATAFLIGESLIMDSNTTSDSPGSRLKKLISPA